MPPTQKLSIEDAIDMVKLCHRHTVDELANNHAHTVATVESSYRLLLGALEYDISHASDHQNNTDDPIYRHVQKASGSKPEGPETGVVKHKKTSSSEDKSKKEQASVPVRSQTSTTATTTTNASHASNRALQASLDLAWRGPNASQNPNVSQRQDTATKTTVSHASTRAPQAPLDLAWRGPKQPSKPQPFATQEQWRNDRR